MELLKSCRQHHPGLRQALFFLGRGLFFRLSLSLILFYYEGRYLASLGKRVLLVRGQSSELSSHKLLVLLLSTWVLVCPIKRAPWRGMTSTKALVTNERHVLLNSRLARRFRCRSSGRLSHLRHVSLAPFVNTLQSCNDIHFSLGGGCWLHIWIVRLPRLRVCSMMELVSLRHA